TRTACDMLTDTVARLAAFDNIIAIKDATGNLVRGGELIAKVSPRMTVLSGDDGTAFPLYALGARGVISVVSNVAPREMAEMWDAVKAGEWAKAKALHYKLRVLNQLLFVEPSPAPTKACLAVLGRCTARRRTSRASTSSRPSIGRARRASAPSACPGSSRPRTSRPGSPRATSTSTSRRRMRRSPPPARRSRPSAPA